MRAIMLLCCLALLGAPAIAAAPAAQLVGQIETTLSANAQTATPGDRVTLTLTVRNVWPDAEPLALKYARAIEEGGSRQRAALRDLADYALFVAGFFSDSLARQVVDVDYYASLGGQAYKCLASFESDTLSPAYRELGGHFLGFADVLTEISEQSGLTSDRDLLRLYERWLSSGSRQAMARLTGRGVAPVPRLSSSVQRVQ